MNKCDCYRVKKIKQSCISQITGMPFWYDAEVSYCNGTKEREECSCGGDKTKCDFYPEVREKARARIGEDSLIVTYDCCSPDAPTLCVARKEKDKVRVLNTIQGCQAFGVYCFLTDNAYLVERQGKWKLNKDGSGTCDQCGITQKNVWDYDNYQNYCGHCGVKMSI